MFSTFLYEAEEITTEVVEETSGIYSYLTPQQIKLGIFIVLVVGIALYFIFKPTEEKMNEATKFLNNLATQIMQIIYVNIEYRISTYDGTIELSFDDFKEKLLNEIYDESWSFVESTIKKAVEEGKLSSITAKFIKEESVKSLVDVVVKRDNVQQKFVEAFNLLFDKYNDAQLQEEEEEAKFAEDCERAPEDVPEELEEESIEAFLGNSESDDIYSEIVEEIIDSNDE